MTFEETGWAHREIADEFRDCWEGSRQEWVKDAGVAGQIARDVLEGDAVTGVLADWLDEQGRLEPLVSARLHLLRDALQGVFDQFKDNVFLNRRQVDVMRQAATVLGIDGFEPRRLTFQGSGIPDSFPTSTFAGSGVMGPFRSLPVGDDSVYQNSWPGGSG